MQLKHVLAAAACWLAASLAVAQAWPARPLTVIVPWPAGGGTDIIARTVTQRLQMRLGQPVVIDNKAGASGIIGTQAAAKAAPDGYTLVLGVTNTHAINASYFKKLPYDPVKDFQPISLLAIGPHLLVVNAANPARTLQELVQAVKAQPGKFSFASYGNGSTAHLAGEALKSAAGLDMTHVPYKGIPPAIIDVVGGQVTMLFSTTAAALPQIKAGKLKALAVTSEKRLDVLPDVPTMQEAGFRDAVLLHWYGLLAPAGTPRPIVDRLARELAAILGSSEIRDTFAVHGVAPLADSPDQFAAFMRDEVARWGKLVAASGVTGD
jgi:tripartite-type tricarboxylate transporter receptor subunit TctC